MKSALVATKLTPSESLPLPGLLDPVGRCRETLKIVHINAYFESSKATLDPLEVDAKHGLASGDLVCFKSRVLNLQGPYLQNTTASYHRGGVRGPT